MRISPYDPRKLDSVIRLSLRAWVPLFDSIQNAMAFDVCRELHPDWRVSQRKAVEEVCAAQDSLVWVAIESASIVGFVVVKLQSESGLGERYMIAVDPDYQRRGIGTA